MKVKLLAGGVAFCTLSIAGCSNDRIDSLGTQVGGQVPITMQVSGSQTRADYTEDSSDQMRFSWRNDDAISVVVSGMVGNENCRLMSGTSGKSVPFDGAVTGWEKGKKTAYAFYPYNSTAYTVTNGDSPESATTVWTLPNPQAYTVGGAVSNSLLVGVGTATAEGGNINATVAMKQVMSIIKLNISNVPADSKVARVKLMCDEAVFPTTATVKLSDATITNPDTKVKELTMMVTDTTDGATKAVSFAMFPADLTGKKINIEVTFNNGAKDIVQAVMKDGKSFMRNVHYIIDFDGLGAELVSKPESYNMALRARVRWKPQFASAPEATPIAFDELYRLKQTDKFTAQYLSQWVEFSSSNPDGQSYIYTDEDIAKTQISEVNYNGTQITLVITYNGIQGVSTQKGRPALYFDRNKFYKRKVTLNRENTKQYYMQGVYENLESFYGNAIQIEDEGVFAAELVANSKSFDLSSNLIGCRLSLVTRKKNTELAQFNFVFDGFKPLSDLSAEWMLATTMDLNAYMQKYMAGSADGDVLGRINKLPIRNWINLAQMFIRRRGGPLKLYREKGRLNDVEVDAWVSQNHLVVNSDILLLNPRFEIVSAKKTGKRLLLEVALVSVNDVTLTDVSVPLEVIL